jgi:hypothetical protein
MKDEMLRLFSQTLYQILGNKRYLHDLEKMLSEVELTPEQKRAVLYLVQDLREHDLRATTRKNRFW